MGKSLYISNIFIVKEYADAVYIASENYQNRDWNTSQESTTFFQHTEVDMILIKPWQLLFFLTVSFLAVSCADSVNPDRYPETRQKTEQNTGIAPGVTGGTEDVYRRWYSNGVLAEETVFAHGKKNGQHRLWYPNGNLKLTGSFIDDRLDGECLAWYENGKSRLAIRFDQGQRTGEWIRTGEKVGVVARVSFRDNRLNGPLTVLVNRGYGNGSGRSLEIQALFHMGRLVSSFRFKEADSSGNNLLLAGAILADGRPQLDEVKNLVFHSGGSLTSRLGDVETSYADLDHFFSSKIANRVMPMFTLEFCDIQIDMTL